MRGSRWSTAAGLACLGGFAAGCASDAGSGAATAVAWCDADPARADVALTPADDEGVWAREGRGAPSFVERWRAGGLNEGEELAFPLNASVSYTGRLAIADFMLANLVLIEPDGRWLPWMRRGQGPGELSHPAAVRWIGASDTLVVYDIGNSRAVFVVDFEPPGRILNVSPDFTGSIVRSGEARWIGVAPDGGVVTAPVPEPVHASTGDLVDAEAPILHLRPGAATPDTLATVVVPTVPGAGFTAPGWPKTLASVSNQATLALGGSDARYRVERFDATGRLIDVICRDAPALSLEDRELKAPEAADPALRSLEVSLAAAPRPDSLAPYGRLFFSAEGNLWVQRERPAALRFGDAYHGVPGALYDVFDPEGRYLGELRAPENARLQAALGDTVWAYEVGELDETWVVAYELAWAAE